MRCLPILIAVLTLAGPACADWQLQCDADKCRAFTYTDKDVALQHIRFMAEFVISAQFFKVSALVAREQYQSDLTCKPQTYGTFDGREYVLEPTFFGSKLRARVRIDGKLLATARPDPKGFIAFHLPVDAVPHGNEIQVQYAVGSNGYGAPLSLALTGLEGVLSKFHQGSLIERLPEWLPSCTDAEMREREQDRERAGLKVFQNACRPDPRPTFNDADEVATVALLLNAANQYAVRSTDLAAIQNPYGRGSFVHVKDRKGFLWFVNDGDVVAVSVLAKSVTPDALDPYDPNVWQSTGLNGDTAFHAGAAINRPH